MYADTFQKSQAEKPKRRWQTPVGSESKALVVLLLLSGALTLSLVGNLILLLNNRALATQDRVFVQQPDGFTVEAQEFDVLHREADVIRQTVTDWIQLTFEWDNRIPGTEATDEGFEIGQAVVPTKAYLASYLLEPGFRTEFLKALGEEVVPRDVYRGNRKSVVRFYAVSDPRRVGQGRWEVDVVSTRVERVGGREDKEVDFNRTFTLQATPPVEPVLGEDEPLAWRKRVYDLAQNGLIITDIVPLSLETQ